MKNAVNVFQHPGGKMLLHREKRILIKLLIMSAILLGCSQSQPTIEQSQFIKYQDQKKRFSIEYPRNWTVNDTIPNVNVIFDSPKESVFDSFIENFSVTVAPLPTTADSPVEDYQEGIIQTIKEQSPWMELVRSTKVTINRRPALELIFKDQHHDVKLDYKLTYMFEGKTGYALVFVCEEGGLAKYDSIVKRMVNSFVVTEQ